jgi:DNA transformation protein and related proteins
MTHHLGPTTRAWLADLGLHHEAEILAQDPIDLADALRRTGHPASLNLVYALAGAQRGLAWNQLPPDLRDDLRHRWQVRTRLKNRVDI